MKSLRRSWIPALVVVAALGGAAAHAPDLLAQREVKPIDRLDPADRHAVEALRGISDGFAAVASVVTPSVVTISAEGEMRPAGANLPDFFDDPMFRQFFGDRLRRPEARPYRGLGSGVIVREDGYIITNNHVVQGADEVTVVLADERRFPAEVIGTDPRTDLAVLRVDATGLPAASLGDSDALRIGEWVLAVGSPLSENLSTSVTAGIVSAVGRNGMGLNAYEDFIQTDAAINPGNSGGALVNLDGELVGINTGIASRGGGSNGIGFAIPANMAAEVMDDLIASGRVNRGWLGVNIGNLDAELAEALSLEDTDGTMVQGVLPDTPAFDAGLRQGDVITAIEGRPLRDTRDLQLTVARTDPGTTVELTVIRDGKEKRVFVELGQFPEEGTSAVQDPNEAHTGDLGMTVEPITPQTERRFELQAPDGLVVTAVSPNGPAADKGIRPGDVILEVNRDRVASLRDYRNALGNREQGKPVLVLVQRGERTFFVGIRPE